MPSPQQNLTKLRNVQETLESVSLAGLDPYLFEELLEALLTVERCIEALETGVSRVD